MGYEVAVAVISLALALVAFIFGGWRRDMEQSRSDSKEARALAVEHETRITIVETQITGIANDLKVIRHMLETMASKA